MRLVELPSVGNADFEGDSNHVSGEVAYVNRRAEKLGQYKLLPFFKVAGGVEPPVKGSGCLQFALVTARRIRSSNLEIYSHVGINCGSRATISDAISHKGEPSGEIYGSKRSYHVFFHVEPRALLGMKNISGEFQSILGSFGGSSSLFSEGVSFLHPGFQLFNLPAGGISGYLSSLSLNNCLLSYDLRLVRLFLHPIREIFHSVGLLPSGPSLLTSSLSKGFSILSSALHLLPLSFCVDRENYRGGGEDERKKHHRPISKRGFVSLVFYPDPDRPTPDPNPHTPEFPWRDCGYLYFLAGLANLPGLFRVLFWHRFQSSSRSILGCALLRPCRIGLLFACYRLISYAIDLLDTDRLSGRNFRLIATPIPTKMVENKSNEAGSGVDNMISKESIAPSYHCTSIASCIPPV